MHQDAPPNTKPIRCCSKVLEHCDEFLPGDTPEYFFDKNPENFTSILNIYRTGNKCLVMLDCKTDLISILGKLHITGSGCALGKYEIRMNFTFYLQIL